MKRSVTMAVAVVLLLLGLASTAVAADSAPAAQDDVYTFAATSDQNKTPLTGLFADNGNGADDLGSPAATLASFGGGSLGGSVGTYGSGSTVDLAGGQITVFVNGSWNLVGGPFEPGQYTFDYRLTNSVGSSTATVTFNIQSGPAAQDDTIKVNLNQANNLPAGKLFADNGSGPDDLGYPLATLASFGNGDLGGTVADNAAGASVAFAGGTLTVNANGSLSVATPTVPGTHQFRYRLDNGVGQADAVVTIDVVDPPQAKRDDYAFAYNANKSVAPAQGLFADNGFGADKRGIPLANVTSFGGGALGGNAGSNPAGATVPLAGGNLTINANGTWSLNGAPFVPGEHVFSYRLSSSSGSSDAEVHFSIQAAPKAKNDDFVTLIGQVTNLPAGALFNDNGGGADERGFPVATISGFGGGDLGGTSTSNAPGAIVPLAGGNVQVNANGSMTVFNPTTFGTYTFVYRLQNGVGFSDASVTLLVAKAPSAKADTYTFDRSAPQDLGGGALFADNGAGADDLGTPPAALVSFGGGVLGGTAGKHLPGTAVSLAGGTLTVGSNGSWSLLGPPFVPGNYTFSYRLRNEGGQSDALVTLNIQGPPLARDDELGAPLGGTASLPPGTLFMDNGSGADVLGFPAATLTSFGGGSLGGLVTAHAAGTAVPFAGGTLTVNGVGSVVIANVTVPGAHTFQYRLTNSKGVSDATVTVMVAEPPQAEDDAMTFQFDADQDIAAAAGLFADNGSGPDFLGTPAAAIVSYGGGSLPGNPSTISAGTSAIMAKGTLTVNSDGSWSLLGAPFTPGTYTFFYRLSNAGGASDAKVTLVIEAAPQAQDDDLAAQVDMTTPFAPGTLFNDNGYGKDELGNPVATLTSFGGGDLGGDVTSNAAGTTVPFAGGTLVVTAVGSLTVTDPTQLGMYTFSYRISNAGGTSDATVTLIIAAAPVEVDVFMPVIKKPVTP